METGKDSIENTFRTRRSSMQFYRLQGKEPTPGFLKDDQVESWPQDVPAKSTDKNQPCDRYIFSMSKTSLFGFLLTISLVSILLFGSGFLIAYLMYHPAAQTTSISAPKAAAKSDEKTSKLQADEQIGEETIAQAKILANAKVEDQEIADDAQAPETAEKDQQDRPGLTGLLPKGLVPSFLKPEVAESLPRDIYAIELAVSDALTTADEIA